MDTLKMFYLNPTTPIWRLEGEYPEYEISKITSDNRNMCQNAFAILGVGGWKELLGHPV